MSILFTQLLGGSQREQNKSVDGEVPEAVFSLPAVETWFVCLYLLAILVVF